MSESPRPIIEAKALCRDYRLGSATIRALSDVSIAISRGEFVSVTGPSGSGKSTLLNLLGGLDAPTRGSIFLDGTELSGLDERRLAGLRRKKLGFVFQRHDLLPALSVAENLEFPLILAGVPEADRRSRIAATLERVGLADKSDNLPEELSGGQQQRVGIARALVNDPEIILADEPTGNLDSRTSGDIMDFLATLCRESGKTLVVVTHDPEVAARADRILRFSDGVQLSGQGAAS